jgi:hypothetical protein
VTGEGEAAVASKSRRGPLARFASGFLFGLGFSVAAVGVILLVSFVEKHMSGQEKADRWHKRFTPDARLTVESHESRATQDNVVILGMVRNSGTDSWDMVQLEVRLHESQAGVVGICRGYVNGPIRPTQLRHFVVDCRGTEREPVPEHTGYDVEVVDANYEREDGA